MGSSLSAISDDIDDYYRLCKRHGEEVRHSPTHQGYMVEDCYGPHAKLLEECDCGGKTPKQVRKERRAKAEAIRALGHAGTGLCRLDKVGDIHYAVDIDRMTEWREWLRLTAEEPSKLLPGFVTPIADISLFTFTNPTNP